MKTILAATFIFFGLSSFGQVQSEQQSNPPKKNTKSPVAQERGVIYGAEMKTKKFKKPESIKLVSNEPKGTIVTNNQ